RLATSAITEQKPSVSMPCRPRLPPPEWLRMTSDLSDAFGRLRKAASGLPEVDEGTSYGTPALKLRKKLLCRVKDPDTVVLICPLEEKELLIAAAPEIYFETDHYRGWPAV